MSERAQLDHVLLDVDFLHKPTVVGFRRLFGWAAVTWLIEIYCQMSRATDALVTRDVMLAIADDMRLERGEEMIAHCIDYGLITQVDVFFTNYRVLKDQESLAKKRKQSKDRQDNFRNKPISNALHNAHETRDPDPVSDTELNIKKEYVIDLPCIKLERNDWDAWVMNFHHGNEPAAREMCVAASDHRQAEGKGLPDNSMSYLRQWYKRSLKFDTPKTKIVRGIQEPPITRPNISTYKPPPKPIDLTEEQKAKNKKLVDELMNKTSKKVAA